MLIVLFSVPQLFSDIFFSFENIRSCFGLIILLPQPLKCWNYRFGQPHSASTHNVPWEPHPHSWIDSLAKI